jgi:hypothetical protein
VPSSFFCPWLRLSGSERFAVAILIAELKGDANKPPGV